MNYICRVMDPDFAEALVTFVEEQVGDATTEIDQIARRTEIMSNIIDVWNDQPHADYSAVPDKFHVRVYNELRLPQIGVTPDTNEIVLEYNGTPITPSQSMVIMSYTPEDLFNEEMNNENAEAIIETEALQISAEDHLPDVINEDEELPAVASQIAMGDSTK